MGIQDRDWYREYQKEKQNPRARPIQELFEKPVYRAHSKPWHWSLIVAFAAIILVVLALAYRIAFR